MLRRASRNRDRAGQHLGRAVGIQGHLADRAIKLLATRGGNGDRARLTCSAAIDNRTAQIHRGTTIHRGGDHNIAGINELTAGIHQLAIGIHQFAIFIHKIAATHLINNSAGCQRHATAIRLACGDRNTGFPRNQSIELEVAADIDRDLIRRHRAIDAGIPIRCDGYLGGAARAANQTAAIHHKSGGGHQGSLAHGHTHIAGRAQHPAPTLGGRIPRRSRVAHLQAFRGSELETASGGHIPNHHTTAHIHRQGGEGCRGTQHRSLIELEAVR